MSAAEKPLAGNAKPAAAQPDGGTPSAPISIRALEERTRSLSLEQQMAECIDLLQFPELVVDDLLRSVAEARGLDSEGARGGVRPPGPRETLHQSDADVRTGFFYPTRELFVQGDGCSFTVLATDLDFRTDAAATHDDPDRRVIDYAAVTCEARPFPVLGFTQRSENESAYPVLLRALSSVVELTRAHRFDLLDRDVYRGLLGPAPVFDLALVLWDDEAIDDPRRPLCELARDLAEMLGSTLAAEPRFPPILNDVVCLRMNNKRFDGRLRFVWRV